MLQKFNNLSLRAKFLISCLWMLLPLGLVTGFLVRENLKTVAIIHQENAGNHIVHHLYPEFLKLTTDPSYKADAESTDHTSNAHEDMDMSGMEMEEESPDQKTVNNELTQNGQKLSNLGNSVGESGKIPEFSASIYKLVGEIERAKSNTGLTADREPETYYLTYLASFAIPKYLKQLADFNTTLSVTKNNAERKALAQAGLILLDIAFEDFEKNSNLLIANMKNSKRRDEIQAMSVEFRQQKQFLTSSIRNKYADDTAKTNFVINYDPTLEESVRYTDKIAELLDRNLIDILWRTWWRLSYQLSLALVAVLIGLVLVRLLLRSVANPLTKATLVMEELSVGQTPQNLPEINQADISRRDEIGKLTKAIKAFHEVLLERKSLRDARILQDEIAQRAERIQQLNRQFNTESRKSLEVLSESSDQLNATAQSMVDSSKNTNKNASSVASAAEQVSNFIDVVATSSNELVEALGVIGVQVENSQQTIRAAVSEAEESINLINNLNQAADKIGAIVGLINSIASQTNLLALNATIEAARAGESGRGFAVVANEVKSLASQTARATDDISGQINQMQNATRDTVRNIERIASTINRIDALASTIMDSLQRERKLTENIANSVKQAEEGAGQVQKNLHNFKSAADQSSYAASQVLGASDELRNQTSILHSRIDTFLHSVGSA